MKKRLRGITWDHSRGLLPMVATAQRFQERHPDVDIVWEKRSLQAFADQPIQDLASQFDLLVIDHPFVGYAAEHPVLVPLDQCLPKSFLRDQACHSVGGSHRSYQYGGHQWAVAIDAAAPVASWRADLLKHPPRTWSEVLELAREGRVLVPGCAVDALMNFYMFCIDEGEEPFRTSHYVVSEAVGGAALHRLKELYALCPPECLSWNPIRVYEAMTVSDSAWYCPLAYGYSNYAREGYARHRLTFGNVVGRLRPTLGGTGLAISCSTRYREVSTEYVQYVASAECQRSLYTENGGQPGHRGGWCDPTANRLTSRFFRNTLRTLDRSYVRPRYCGYLQFQDAAGPVLNRFLKRGGSGMAVLRKFNLLYLESLTHRPKRVS
jgi:multiple sugar transport system substrate-binding protein